MFLNNLFIYNEADDDLDSALEASEDENGNLDVDPNETDGGGDTEENNEEDTGEDTDNTGDGENINDAVEETEQSSNTEGEEDLDDGMGEADGEENEDGEAPTENEVSPEENQKRYHFFNSFLKMSDNIELFIEKLNTLMIDVSDFDSKNDLKVVNNELIKLNDDINELLLKRIKLISNENLDKLNTIFQTKTETLVDLAQKLIKVKTKE